MPGPSTTLATLRPDLAGSFTEFDIEYARSRFGALQLLRLIEVAEKAGKFGRIKLESFLKAVKTNRNPGSGYKRGTFEFTDESYDTQEKGVEQVIDDGQASIYRHYFDAEYYATQKALWQVMLDFELEVSSALMTTSYFGAGFNAAVTGFLSNASAARFVADVNKASNAIYAKTGMYANAVVISEKQFKYLIRTDEVKDEIKADGAGETATPRKVTINKLKEILDLEHVIVPGGTYDSAAAGQTRSLAEIWPKNLSLVCRVAESGDIEEPCLGRSFHWAEDGSLPQGVIESYRDETVRGDVIRARRQLGWKIYYKECGYLLTNVLDTND